MIFAPGEIGRIEEPAAARAAQARLQDAELAAVLTRIRSQRGNGAAPVGADTVVSVRKEIAARTEPFKGDDKLAAHNSPCCSWIRRRARVSEAKRQQGELDHVRLKSLIQRHRHGDASSAHMDAIEDMLDEASVVPSTPVSPDVVTMYSQVVVLDAATGQRNTLAVCYPSDAEPEKGFVSALSPVGWSLLGLRVGEVAHWSTPAGEQKPAEIVAILFQPEASGDYTM
ncbi:MAG: GreA/GreB family elongation factor [Rubrivivax sp.]|nr:GreA/GreB family elongation factor [Rubrivivax sp.]